MCLEATRRDELHLRHYVIEAGGTAGQAKAVLDTFCADHVLIPERAATSAAM